MSVGAGETRSLALSPSLFSCSPFRETDRQYEAPNSFSATRANSVFLFLVMTSSLVARAVRCVRTHVHNECTPQCVAQRFSVCLRRRWLPYEHGSQRFLLFQCVECRKSQAVWSPSNCDFHTLISVSVFSFSHPSIASRYDRHIGLALSISPTLSTQLHLSACAMIRSSWLHLRDHMVHADGRTYACLVRYYRQPEIGHKSRFAMQWSQSFAARKALESRYIHYYYVSLRSPIYPNGICEQNKTKPNCLMHVN